MDLWTDKALNEGVIVAVGVSRRGGGGGFEDSLCLSAECLEQAKQTDLS